MKLPILFNTDTVLQLLQSKWSSVINPFLDNPSNQASILNNIVLISGTNVINHLLDRTLKGWRIIRINGIASIYDTQSSNQTPTKTLILISNAAVTISIEVF